ncbi:MAG: urease accessory protein UreD [Anaerovoracaceae bacterium]
MENPTGKLSMVFRKKESGKTYLAEQYFKLPLQIMNPYYQDKDGTAFIYMLNPSGGILQHDRLLTEIKLEKNTKVLVTTPSSTKFYKMDEGYARLENYMTLEEEAVLEYLPEYNTPFAESNTEQENIFRLKKSSILIASEMVTAGRISRGESFKFERYDSKTKIYVDDQLLVYDSSLIEPGKTQVSTMGLMEKFSTVGTMYVYKEGLPKGLIEEINQITLGNEIKLGATQIEQDIMIVRIMGVGAQDMQEAMLEIWNIIRRTILNKGGVRIRKY